MVNAQRGPKAGLPPRRQIAGVLVREDRSTLYSFSRVNASDSNVWAGISLILALDCHSFSIQKACAAGAPTLWSFILGASD